MCRGSMYASKLACAMLPAITVPTASGEIPDRLKTSRATLIPRSIGDTSPSAVPYSANGVRTPSINHTLSYCEIRPLVCLAINSQLPADPQRDRNLQFYRFRSPYLCDTNLRCPNPRNQLWSAPSDAGAWLR